MRRSILTAAASGLAALLFATSGTSPAPASASTGKAPVGVATASASVRLITGETVMTRKVVGRVVTTVVPAAGESGGLLRLTTSKSSLAIPTSALRYLGTVLDPALFDVAHLRSGETVHVSSARAASLNIPGLHVAKRSSTQLSGTFDALGSVAFGAALRAQAAKDRVTGHPASSLFGASRISLSSAPAKPVKPAFAQVTMRFSVLDRSGRPAELGDLFLMNVDDADRFSGDVPVVAGQARASLPKGRYTAFAFISQESSDAVVTIPQLTVTTNMQLRTIDARTATARVGLTTQRPTDASYENTIATWHRQVDGDDWSTSFDGSVIDFGRRGLWVAPSAAPTRGTASWSTFFVNGSDPTIADPYTYWAAFAEHGAISPAQQHTITRFATVDTSYFKIAPGTDDNISRTPLLPESDLSFSIGIEGPTSGHSTDYLASSAGAVWQDDYIASLTDEGVFGEVVDVPRVLAAGRSYRTDFLRGPLAAGVLAPATVSEFACDSCRVGNELSIVLDPVTDSDSGHAGSLMIPDESTVLGTFAVWQDGKLISSQTNSSSAFITAPARDTTFRARVETWPSRNGFARSTHAVTDLTFHSSAADPVAPAGWVCPWQSSDDDQVCRVPAILATSVPLPTRIDSTMSVGNHPFVFTVAPDAGHAAVTATVAISFDGGRSFSAVPVQALGHNRFRAALSNPTAAAGKKVTIRVTGRTAAGDCITQTTDAAYVVTKA